VVNDYASSCAITSEFAGISVSSRGMIKGDVQLKNQNGDVNLFLPDKASFVIDATARNGTVESDYSGLGLGKNGKSGVLKSTVRNGGPKIFLETSNGNIRIHPTQSDEAEPAENAEDPAQSSAVKMQGRTEADIAEISGLLTGAGIVRGVVL
jgi:DUF4097 and DUF4098 domain-containing protein YvlB